MKKQLNIGLIGHGFMGKAHSHAYHDLEMFFDTQSAVVRHTLCGVGGGLEDAAKRYGFPRITSDWREVVENPEIDIIDICTPDSSHRDIAMAAAAANKHVICEKPLALDARQAKEMLEAVKRSGVKHMCNFVYRGVPAIRLAKTLLDEKRLGKVYAFKAQYLQDFSLSPQFPFVWRMDHTVAGAGILADKGAHLIDQARYLVGEIASLTAMSSVFIPERIDPYAGTPKKVTSGDSAAFLAQFENGAMGVFEMSNMAAGHKNSLLLEINCEKGSITFDLERLNELRVYSGDGSAAESGFKTILATEPGHAFISHWWPSGHVLGWEHAFTHQIHDLITAIEQDTEPPSNFYDGWRCQQAVDAAALSEKQRDWITIKEKG